MYSNYLRYQNDTIANLMYDTQLKKNEYARINSVAASKNTQFYVRMSAFHTLSFIYLAYFFRFRRVNLGPAFLISCGYYYFFQKTNNIAYKWFVDRNVIKLTRQLGHEQHIQPVGHFKNRGLNYVWGYFKSRDDVSLCDLHSFSLLRYLNH